MYLLQTLNTYKLEFNKILLSSIITFQISCLWINYIADLQHLCALIYTLVFSFIQQFLGTLNLIHSLSLSNTHKHTLFSVVRYISDYRNASSTYPYPSLTGFADIYFLIWTLNWPNPHTSFCSSPKHVWNFLAKELTLNISLTSTMWFLFFLVSDFLLAYVTAYCVLSIWSSFAYISLVYTCQFSNFLKS